MKIISIRNGNEELSEILKEIRELKKMSVEMDTELQDLGDRVNVNTTVEQSAIVLLDGLAAKITALADQIKADPANVAKLVDLGATLKKSSDALAADIAANTVAVP